MALKVSESLAASNSTASLVIKEGFVSVQGTWTGTINIEVDPMNNATWSNVTDETGTALAYTGNINLAIDNGAPIKTRVKFTRSSGTAVIALIGE